MRRAVDSAGIRKIFFDRGKHLGMILNLVFGRIVWKFQSSRSTLCFTPAEVRNRNTYVKRSIYIYMKICRDGRFTMQACEAVHKFCDRQGYRSFLEPSSFGVS